MLELSHFKWFIGCR